MDWRDNKVMFDSRDIEALEEKEILVNTNGTYNEVLAEVKNAFKGKTKEEEHELDKYLFFSGGDMLRRMLGEVE